MRNEVTFNHAEVSFNGVSNTFKRGCVTVQSTYYSPLLLKVQNKYFTDGHHALSIVCVLAFVCSFCNLKLCIDRKFLFSCLISSLI